MARGHGSTTSSRRSSRFITGPFFGQDSGMEPYDVYAIITQIQQLTAQLDSWSTQLQEQPQRGSDASFGNVHVAYQRLQAGMGRNSDVSLRYITIPASPRGPILVTSIDGMADTDMLNQGIIQPLLSTKLSPDLWDQGALTPIQITKSTTWPDLIKNLTSGNTLLFAPDLPWAWVVDTAKYPQRAIGRPQTELAVRGPEEAFNEVLMTQKTQVRRRLRTPQLLFHDVTLGKVQQTTVSVAYLEEIANPALVATVIDRVKSINIDGAVTVTQIAGLIRDHPHSIFPTIRQSERVDFAVWRLLEGATLVMMDGDPFVLIAPAPLIDFYRTAMDYSSSWIDTSFVRFIRFSGWLLGIYLPALYVALSEVNPSVLPSSLFVILQGSNAGIPFPPIIQVILMIVVIETLREAALRLPKVLATTIGTVGAIVVGTAVVKAGLVDTQIIVIMTLTALSIFSTPTYELTATWRVINFLILGTALYLGIFGIVLMTMAILVVVIDMQSFGTPYFAPWAPFRMRDWVDAIWRLPWTNITRRLTIFRSLRPTWRKPATVSRKPHLRKGHPS